MSWLCPGLWFCGKGWFFRGDGMYYVIILEIFLCIFVLCDDLGKFFVLHHVDGKIRAEREFFGRMFTT